ncbi:hypothetical protein OHA88_43870 [Streptomyces sp. NBC_00353]|uniref:hypothetical protein n=1 Tax=Streptomyces sp. NBC_00353 TaxID=2975722 RepID=UPI002E25C4F6
MARPEGHSRGRLSTSAQNPLALTVEADITPGSGFLHSHAGAAYRVDATGVDLTHLRRITL